MISEAEIERLVEDIRVNGYDDRLPIATLDGKVLDGRNRWEAAQQAEVTPFLVELLSGNPLWKS